MPWQVLMPDSRRKAVHAVLLPRGDRGEVLYFIGFNSPAGTTGGMNPTFRFAIQPPGASYTDTAFVEIPADQTPRYNMFCSGHAFLPDGRVLFAGGHLALFNTAGEPIPEPPIEPARGHLHGHGAGMAWGGERRCSIFDTIPGTWLDAPLLSLDPAGNANSGGRWYPTLTTLGNGEVLAVGGHPDRREMFPPEPLSRHSANIPERYTPWTNVWTLLGDASASNDQKTALDIERDEFDYHRTFLLPNGRVFFASPVRGFNRTYDHQARTFVGSPQIALPSDSRYGEMDGTWTAVLLPLLHQEGFRPRVLLMGGVTAQRIDLGVGGIPQWQQIQRDWSTTPRGNPPPERRFLLGTILPTGDIFFSGGVATPAPNQPLSGVVEGEIYNPGINWAAGAFFADADPARPPPWQIVEPAVVPRHYHSTALLLPDGSVWTAGSDPFAPGDADELRIEIYSPAYVGQAGRPMLTDVIGEGRPPGAPPAVAASISYGTPFQIGTQTGQASDIRRVVLLRCGSVTHAFNPDQRYLSLDFRLLDGQTLQAVAPPSGNVAPPGYYMVWILNAAGLPCVEAKFVLLSDRRAVFYTDKNTFSREEVDAVMNNGVSVFSAAFYVHVYGFAPSEVGVSTLNPTAAQLAGFAPAIALTLPSGITGVQASVEELLPEDRSRALNVPQRLVFRYALRFTAPIPPSTIEFSPITLTATSPQGTQAAYSATGTVFVKNQPAPYVLDGSIPWLSVDLRVMMRLSQTPLRPGSALVMGDDPLTFVRDVVAAFESGTESFETALPSDPEQSELLLSATDGAGRRAFNFAVARVRYRATATVAGNVRVFFRLFDWLTTGLEFEPSLAYRTHPAGPVPLLGIDGAREVVSIPFFAEPRVNTGPGGVAMTAQPPAPGVSFAATGAEVVHYFGAWLDFNRTEPRFPRVLPTANPEGPYATASSVPIMTLIGSEHPCLVAEVHFTPVAINAGLTPAESDRLAQRNISFATSANPAGPDAHTVSTTFDLKLSTPPLPDPESGLVTPFVPRPDELMLRLNDIPAASHVTVYFANRTAAEVAAMTTAHGGPSLEIVDENTVRCPAGGAAYLALPGNPGDRISGLLSVVLPQGITIGQTFRIVGHQLSGGAGRVQGTFEMFVPVKATQDIILRDRRRLSVFRYILSTLPAGDLRHALLGRLVGQVENRLRALGVDPTTIGPSPDGDGGKTQWKIGVAYNVGDEVVFNGLDYRCRQAHTAQVGWEPPSTYALWERIHAGTIWAPQVVYQAGAEVTYNGQAYVAIQGHQSQPGWEPPNVPALWQQYAQEQADPLSARQAAGVDSADSSSVPAPEQVTHDSASR